MFYAKSIVARLLQFEKQIDDLHAFPVSKPRYNVPLSESKRYVSW